MSENDGVPPGWAVARLREVTIPCGTRNPRTCGDGEFAYVDIDALDNAHQRIATPKWLPNGGAPSRARMRIASGDVLFSLVRPYLKNIALVPDELDDQIASTAYCVLRPAEAIASLFLFYFITQEAFIQSVPTYGNSPPAARDEEFLDLPLPIAPLPEQRRIVEKIEELFSMLDAGVAALERVRANLKRYRASVLKAAVEGRLTEEWRAKHPDTEPASVLLNRILQERRRKWEEDQLVKFAEKGQKPPAGWQAKYKPPAPPDISDLADLPEGWAWASVGQLGMPGQQTVLTGPFGTDLGTGDMVTAGTPLLTIGCLTHSGLSWAKAVYVSQTKADELSRYVVRTGDVLFSRQASVGRAGLVTGQFAGSLINYHLMRLRLQPQTVIPAYFVVYVRGADTVRDYVREVNHGATRDGINTEQLLSMPVALPPLSEQAEIVAEVERRLSVVDEIEMETTAGLKRAAHLRQSILKRAFEGRLVPQDPTDEPASVLLERIKEERQQATSLASPTRRRHNAGTRQSRKS
ncbi:MAG: restriction endonuclease subunit S [Armatimonadia bacterium]